MKSNKINLFIITVLFIFLTMAFYGKSGNMLIDFSRESYIPYQMLNHEELCKDIFLIYGNFGYLLNALLYKISLNINIILIEALCISYCTILLFYSISKKIVTQFCALIFTILFICISIFSNSNFSFMVPYSYSTLWGVFGLYLILFSYMYGYNKLKYFMLGFVAINKIEFFMFAFIFTLFFDIYNKKFKFKNYIYILILPLLSLCFININNYINNFYYISKMFKTNALSSLYRSLGSMFEINYFVFNIVHLLFYTTVSILSYLTFKKNKIISFLILCIFFINVYPNTLVHSAAFLAVLLAFINRNKIKNKEYVLLFFSLVLCSKSIFAISPLLYSNFGCVMLFLFVFKQFSRILNRQWAIGHLVIFVFFMSITSILDYIKIPKKPVKTSVGTIYVSKYRYELFKNINSYLNKNLKENETFIVVPEGQIFNLIHKKPWKYYNSTFTPLDFETFGEDYLINKLKENKTDYIIFYPRDTKEYGAQTICYDYGVDFCTYIMDNYQREALYGNNAKVLIFKIK